MPFAVKVESESLLDAFDAMQERVQDLEVRLPEVFLDWQRDDMNRKYPAINDQAPLSVTTFIYPRSRLPRGPKGKGNSTRKRARVAAGRPGAKRPILRPVLVEQLFARMVTMCKEAIQWQ